MDVWVSAKTLANGIARKTPTHSVSPYHIHNQTGIARAFHPLNRQTFALTTRTHPHCIWFESAIVFALSGRSFWFFFCSLRAHFKIQSHDKRMATEMNALRPIKVIKRIWPSPSFSRINRCWKVQKEVSRWLIPTHMVVGSNVKIGIVLNCWNDFLARNWSSNLPFRSTECRTPSGSEKRNREGTTPRFKIFLKLTADDSAQQMQTKCVCEGSGKIALVLTDHRQHHQWNTIPAGERDTLKMYQNHFGTLSARHSQNIRLNFEPQSITYEYRIGPNRAFVRSFD